VGSTDSPRIWLLIGDKLGDNQQVELIGERLAQRYGWRCETRRLHFKPAYKSGKPTFDASRDHVAESSHELLSPPWPDVLITIGRRPSMVALWIARQAAGATRLVIVGRPRRWLDRFDLIVAPAHHHVPEAANVVRLGLPLIVPGEKVLAAAAEAWRPRFASMRRPLFALFVGGPTKPHVFDAAVARDLMRRTNEVVAREHGSLWVTTSPRTSADVVDALDAALPQDGRLFRFAPGSADNPYLGLLACADRFIVTGDSVSMQVEVARLGKPLAIYALPAEYGFVEYLRRRLARIAYGENQHGAAARAIKALQRIGVMQFPRDVTEIQQLLYRRHLAVPLGEPFIAANDGIDVDLDVVVERIAALARGATRGRPIEAVGSDDCQGKM
jgi:mitochondrial fission protein ELM1